MEIWFLSTGQKFLLAYIFKSPSKDFPLAMKPAENRFLLQPTVQSFMNITGLRSTGDDGWVCTAPVRLQHTYDISQPSQEVCYVTSSGRFRSGR